MSYASASSVLSLSSLRVNSFILASSLRITAPGRFASIRSMLTWRCRMKQEQLLL